MNERFPYAEQVAANLLRHYGAATISQLRQSAANAYREGNEKAARSIQDIADAAERIWSRHSEDNRSESLPPRAPA